MQKYKLYKYKYIFFSVRKPSLNAQLQKRSTQLGNSACEEDFANNSSLQTIQESATEKRQMQFQAASTYEWF